MSATMVTGRAHRMTELFGRLAPGADLEAARAELRTVYSGILTENPAEYPTKSHLQTDAKLLRDQLTSPARNRAPTPVDLFGTDLRHRVLQRREPDSGPISPPRRRAIHTGGAGRHGGRVAPNAAR